LGDRERAIQGLQGDEEGYLSVWFACDTEQVLSEGRRSSLLWVSAVENFWKIFKKF